MDPGDGISPRLSSIANQFDPKSVYIPADYDAKLSQALIERDSQKRQTEYQEVMKTIYDQYCLVIPIYIQPNLLAYNPQVQDLDYLKFASRTWNPAKAWLSK
jgi:ABC-type oligopeptide transport system substrate-binding subunit